MLTFGLVASPADAHSFLVRTSPQPGARLTAAPTEVVLDFTDPVAAHESTVVLRDEHGVAVTLLGHRAGQLRNDDAAGGHTSTVVGSPYRP